MADSTKSQTTAPKAAAPTQATSGASSLSDIPPAAFDKRSLTFLRPAQQAGELGRLASYRILKVIGEGGMGLVLQAQDVNLDRLVALKVMHPRQATNQQAKQRFLLEAKAAAKIEHENIVPIYQVGEDNGVPFIAMPFLQGETLAERIRRTAPLPWRDAARIAREMAEGLAAAHAQGLVHRDIKPANIWLEQKAPSKANTPGKVRILDFGLARNTSDDTHITQQGSILGTPAYMSPEQAKGEDVDLRTDLFSLGSILYQMGTGKYAFPGATPYAIIAALQNTVPKPMREINAQIPEGLAQVVLKLLEKDRNRRPKSAELVAQAIAGVEKNPSMSFLKKTDAAPTVPTGPGAFAFNGATTAPINPAENVSIILSPPRLPGSGRATQSKRSRSPLLWAAGGLGMVLVAAAAVYFMRGEPRPPAKPDGQEQVSAPPKKAPKEMHPILLPEVKPPEVKPPEVKPPEVKPPEKLPPVDEPEQFHAASYFRQKPAQVVDNEAAMLVGEWKSSVYSTPFHGSDYLHDDNKMQGKKSATYVLKLPEDGMYEVWMIWNTGMTRSSKIPVEIQHEDGAFSTTINQRIRGGWNKLATLKFRAGEGGRVIIRNDNSDGHVIADAVAWVPVKTK